MIHAMVKVIQENNGVREGSLEEVIFNLCLERFEKLAEDPCLPAEKTVCAQVWGGSRVGPARDSRCME